MSPPTLAPAQRAQIKAAAAFQNPSTARSTWQFGSTGALYAGTLVLMYLSYQVSAWLTLALAIPAGGLVVRLFTIQHDCGHGSYFRHKWANVAVGWLCSFATMTPFSLWRRHHSVHHATWNHLDKRDNGTDIYSTVITLKEYQALPGWRRFGYRLLLHPLVSQLLVPPVVFLVLYRVPFDTPRTWTAERRQVWLLNAGLLVGLGGLAWWMGPWPVLLVQASVVAIAAIVGVWLFAIQHRFEDSLWAGSDSWTAASAAVHGSSFLSLPGWLHWFTGSIGYHHVHHLVPRVPNYRLRDCHEACSELFGSATRLTLWQALKAPAFALWDEDQARMVRFPR